MQNWCEPHVCILLLLLYFFSNICDYIKEGPVLLLLFPSLSLSPLIGPLKHGVCVCCFVLFVLSGCYVVLLCVKKNKKMLITKKKILFIKPVFSKYLIKAALLLLLCSGFNRYLKLISMSSFLCTSSNNFSLSSLYFSQYRDNMFYRLVFPTPFTASLSDAWTLIALFY